MLLKTYYALKPYLPLELRYWLRNRRARFLRQKHAATWPIDPASAQAPADWAGWPESKRFAFVLTHDVEGEAGYDKVMRLVEWEKKEGFRSAFHFIPEGSYTVSTERRRELQALGFEVGVHDLHHDGSLFACQRSFLRQAVTIRRYLKDWQVGGFRAGFMFHNLKWIHELGCAYDLSTFDTDPFEPQPDGVRTLYPFWVSRSQDCPLGLNTRPPFAGRPAHDAYLEIPYTLPQDSTLFLILRESSPRLWLEKLDWIAAQGGLALVNVHPDYIQFPGEPASPHTYPLEHYLALLRHVNQHHAHTAWRALPRDIHQWLSRPRS